MAARSIASLSLSFGLVSIPVKIYSATESRTGVTFNLLHKGFGPRLRQQYVCIREDVVVERSDMVKGYEFEPDHYAVLEPDELKALEDEAKHTVDIVSFMPSGAIDPIYFDTAYYPEPDKRGGKIYRGDRGIFARRDSSARIGSDERSRSCIAKAQCSR